MNCYNSARFLREAIDSVLSQTYLNWELICFDNNSNDSTQLIIRSYDDDRIKYFRSDNYLTLSTARNKAIGNCSGTFIAFLDSDDIWISNKLEKQVELLVANPLLGLVYSDVTYFNWETSKEMRLYHTRTKYVGDCFREMITDYFLCISSCIIRSQIVRSNHIKFNDSLEVCEDYDYFLRIALESPIDLVPEVLTKYRLHNGSLTYNKRILFIEEKSFLLKKYLLIEKVRTKYSDAIYKSIENNIFDHVKLLLTESKYSEARMVLLDCRKSNLKYWFYYFSTFFPYSIILFLYNLFFPNRIRY